jgi:hypothetical protein
VIVLLSRISLNHKSRPFPKATGDAIGHDRHGRTILAIAVDGWLLDALAEREDLEEEEPTEDDDPAEDDLA